MPFGRFRGAAEGWLGPACDGLGGPFEGALRARRVVGGEAARRGLPRGRTVRRREPGANVGEVE